jgi:hypothetical protein
LERTPSKAENLPVRQAGGTEFPNEILAFSQRDSFGAFQTLIDLTINQFNNKIIS